jgi:hypothetical protein
MALTHTFPCNQSEILPLHLYHGRGALRQKSQPFSASAASSMRLALMSQQSHKHRLKSNHEIICFADQGTQRLTA